jgi:hypothetical protein
MDYKLIDERSRQMHVLIAERLRRDPSLVDRAKENLARWRLTSSADAYRTLDEWKYLLNCDFDHLLSVLVSTDEEATRLRQSSPFAGPQFISQAERLEFIGKFQRRAQLAKFASPETYISGTTALSIPDEGRSGGDWHFVETFCEPEFYIHSAGTQGSLVNTNPILGARMVVDKAAVLRRYGVDCENIERLFCAAHPRAVADLLYHSLTKGIYPAHVSLDGGIFEEQIEFLELEQLLDLMGESLDPGQLADLLRWEKNHFQPLKDAVAA